ncbi:hypothetical protein, partial [Novosphingobium sp. AP12]|uniref:hypothetical protein n=1 Tax=Novosphingobium sp. AP12 TaxID=1144305 RepID=UPI0012FC7093
MSDLTDQFFIDKYGVVSREANIQLVLIHEIAMHGGLKEGVSPSGKDLTGHSGVFQRLLTSDPNSTDLKLKTSDILGDRVEGATFIEGKNRGLIVATDDTKTTDAEIYTTYLEGRRDAFQGIIDDYVRAHNVRTVGELIEAEKNGLLVPEGTRMVIYKATVGNG